MSHMLNIANILTEHDTVLQSVRNDAKLLQNLEIFTNKVIECYNLDGKILLVVMAVVLPMHNTSLLSGKEDIYWIEDRYTQRHCMQIHLTSLQ